MVCVEQRKLLTIEVQDPSTGVRFSVVPGGAIEEGESPKDAAIRETLEETGFVVNALDEIESIQIRYPFVWERVSYDRITTLVAGRLSPAHFISGELIPIPNHVCDAKYILRHEWLPLENIPDAFAYEPKLLAAIRSMVTQFEHCRDLSES